MPIQNLQIFKKLLIVTTFVILSTATYSQTKEKLRFNYSIDSVLIDNSYKYTIQIVVDEGDGPFVFELCDKALAIGGKSIEKSVSTVSKKYIFSNLPRQEYYVYVYLSNEEFGRGKKIQLK